MLFTDLSFWAFFAVVVVLYALLPHRAQNRMLLVASYVFYGAWDWRFCLLLLASSLINYATGVALRRAGAAPVDMPATPERVWRALRVAGLV